MSAFYRARFPRSWWWTPEFDMFSAVQFTLQVANRQRVKRGPKPKALKRPREVKMPQSAAELEKKQTAQADWLAKRRAQKELSKKAVNHGY